MYGSASAGIYVANAEVRSFGFRLCFTTPVTDTCVLNAMPANMNKPLGALTEPLSNMYKASGRDALSVKTSPVGKASGIVYCGKKKTNDVEEEWESV